MKEPMRWLVLGAVAAGGLQTLRYLRLIHLEMMDHRASFNYVAEMHFAQEEHERRWVEARNPRIGPDPGMLEDGDRWHMFITGDN